MTTYNGPPNIVNGWTESWEEYFPRQIRSHIAFLQNVYGADTELVKLVETFIQKVVARLLRPLQTGGRNIKPTLCHGDLWDGNVQIDVETKQPVMFDSCTFYGHNEVQHNEGSTFRVETSLTPSDAVDLQCMGDPRYVLGMDFIDMYKNEVGASEPKEDFYDRHNMYTM